MADARHIRTVGNRRKAQSARRVAEESASHSLKDYDSDRFGPYLGVSGEGSAAVAIVAAALASPKVRALSLKKPIEIGVAHDAERLGSIGELPVGPDEYEEIRGGSGGRILTSTNVGARLNLRYYGRAPLIWINVAPLAEMVEKAKLQAAKMLAPFLQTPDSKPRPIVLFARFKARIPRADRIRILRELVRSIAANEIGDPVVHKIGLMAKVRRGKTGIKDAIQAMNLAREAGIKAVAVEGVVRSQADEDISLSGLLQYFNPREAQELLRTARRKEIALTPRNCADTDSMARQAWAGLWAARSYGLELGKYGLSPLTFEESERVVQDIQRWFPDWTAAPVFYVDIPYVIGTNIYSRRDIVEALRSWMRMIARHHVAAALVDTVNKSQGWKILKTGRKGDKGILSLEDITELDRFARHLGLRILWAGGITMAQAYEFGRIGVFGIYVTSEAAVARPVTPAHRRDTALASERLATKEKVFHVKLLLEAGFLSARGINSKAVDTTARLLLQHLGSGAASHTAISSLTKRLHRQVFISWKLHESRRIPPSPGQRPGGQDQAAQ